MPDKINLYVHIPADKSGDGVERWVKKRGREMKPGHLTLGGVIKMLRGLDPSRVVPLGFNEPHSYRGYYEDLAFEPAENITIGEMLEAAEMALGATYTGYKGGDYKMGEYTEVWLAEWGSCGESIGRIFLSMLLEAADTVVSPENQSATSGKEE